MKIDRLIGILSLLLQTEKMTANQLAEKFEVSRRTIMRDIEDINRAGIPIVTTQGKGGGVSIMDGFKIDRTALSFSEMRAIIAGLKSLDSVSETNRYRLLMDKLNAGSSSEISNSDSYIIIDLSMWDKSAVSPKIEVIRNAIENSEKICFYYYAPSGDGFREIEPYYLIFQWSGWYVWGFCTLRNDYRMFKLSRITNLKSTGQKNKEREVLKYKCNNLKHCSNEIKATVKFDNSVKWRLIDEYGADFFTETQDGYILMSYEWWDLTSFYSWILSFGDKAEIIEPVEYRNEFKMLIKDIYDKY